MTVVPVPISYSLFYNDNNSWIGFQPVFFRAYHILFCLLQLCVFKFYIWGNLIFPLHYWFNFPVCVCCSFLLPMLFYFLNLLELFHSSWNSSYFHFLLITTCSLCNSHHCFVKPSRLILIPIFPLLTFNHILYESRLLPFFSFHAPPNFSSMYSFCLFLQNTYMSTWCYIFPILYYFIMLYAFF